MLFIMIRKNHFFIAVLALMFYSISIHAQQDTLIAPETPVTPEKEKTPLKDRLFVGGGLGLQFGSNTYIDISPLFGYRVNDKLSVGLGPNYAYNRYKDAGFTYTRNIYGGRLFARYYIYDNFFAQFEPTFISTKVRDDFNYNYYRKNVISPYVGGGYIQKFNDYSGVYIMILYDVFDSPYSPYSNPDIRIGFNIGL